MAISYVDVGTFQSGTADIVVPPPAGILNGDLLILLVHSANETINTPTGTTGTWTEIGSQAAQGTGTAGGIGAVRLGVFYKFTNGTESDATVTDTGNLTVGQMLAIRGVDRLNPFAATAGGAQASAAAAPTLPAVSPTMPNAFIVFGMAVGRDANSTANFNALTNANLTNITERIDRTVNTANGGGLACWTANDSTAGSTGTSTTTKNGAWTDANGYLTMALRPKRRVISYM